MTGGPTEPDASEPGPHEPGGPGPSEPGEPGPSEQDLIARARDGDQDAFAELVMRHADRVYGALRRFGLDAGDADEVTQEVFLRAWRGLARFEQRARFSTWLYRIAFNEAQRRLSRRTLPRAIPRAEDDAHDPVAGLPEPAESGPEARALADELERQLDAALEQLPAEWRAAVVLRDIEGLSTHDAAEVVGVGEAAFKSRLHRGRMQLRELLGPYLGS
ncbi:MAG TPA: sigma-70 family RNA polymerase sigma factor [Solirubrobacteraceae bacterium]|nr:sigma-70 family RNA polymerase sigma factor [Solirubrobacteraceae bacterium]